MTFLQFIASVIDSLAWPAVVVVALIVLKGPISSLIQATSRLKYKDAEAEFGRKLDELGDVAGRVEVRERELKALPAEVALDSTPKTQRELIDQLTDLSPSAAILQSWKNIERTLDFYFSARSKEKPRSFTGIVRHLDFDSHFPSPLVSVLKQLRDLRNAAAHQPEPLPREYAEEFSALADRVTFALVEAATPY